MARAPLGAGELAGAGEGLARTGEGEGTSAGDGLRQGVVATHNGQQEAAVVERAAHACMLLHIVACSQCMLTAEAAGASCYRRLLPASSLTRARLVWATATPQQGWGLRSGLARALGQHCT